MLKTVVLNGMLNGKRYSLRWGEKGLQLNYANLKQDNVI